MDYLTLLRDAHAELQRKREETVGEIRKVTDELCHVLQKVEEVFSSPQVAILMERVTRQEALIAAEEKGSEFHGSWHQLSSADVCGAFHMGDLPEPAFGEYDEFGA